MSGIPYRRINTCTAKPAVTGVQCNSRSVCPGQIFVCIKGNRADGRDYVKEAMEKGCCVLITDRPTGYLRLVRDIPVLLVADTRKAYARLCRNFYGCPDRYLVMIGITGTKGKTSTAWMIYSILKASGRKCAMIGTTGIVTEKGVRPLFNTTPEPEILHRTLRELVEAGYTHLVIEVSSQALMQHRTEGILFDYGIFTNLSPDHIGPGEHGSFAEYAYWKTQLLGKSIHAICSYRDSGWIRRLMQKFHIRKQLVTFGEETGADYCLEQCDAVKEPPLGGLTFTVRYPRENKIRHQALSLPLFGDFQARNAVAAFACTREMGCALMNQKKGLAHTVIPGRGELVYRGSFCVMIDYAHNGESLKSLLAGLRPLWKGKIICLFGCGGNRAPARRFEMSRISGLLADETVLTEDNSRNEPLKTILDDLESGIKETHGAYRIIPDRKEAIRRVILEAAADELIILAGKGHEEYMEQDGKRVPFSERMLARNAIRERKETVNGTCNS